jgi:hypothetical protein
VIAFWNSLITSTALCPSPFNGNTRVAKRLSKLLKDFCRAALVALLTVAEAQRVHENLLVYLQTDNSEPTGFYGKLSGYGNIHYVTLTRCQTAP